ncbi:MAG: linear amide C-N hydrolase [Parachlamydiaceae bacterium]|nr:linear amide C-N hydrolase [Parachlamydiaceae bacterium]
MSTIRSFPIQNNTVTWPFSQMIKAKNMINQNIGGLALWFASRPREWTITSMTILENIHLLAMNRLMSAYNLNEWVKKPKIQASNEKFNRIWECCSEFFLAKSLVAGRTLDFPMPIFSYLVKFPVGEQLTSKDPDGNSSFKWTSKYGFVGITGFGDENNCGNVIEGINTEGLSYSSLTLEATEYQTVPKDQMDRAMAVSDFPVWLLGTCATIDDVKQSLSNVYVWGDTIFPIGVPAFHFAFHDKNGESLVVEYVDGQLNMYDNPLGMLTNDPPFPEQLETFHEYDSLNTGFAPGSTYPGTGMQGLPGDWSTQSRFVRGGKLLQNVKIEKGCEIQMAMQILGSLEVPKGIKLAWADKNHDYDRTHWKTITDIANLQLFYQTATAEDWFSVDLKCLDFTNTERNSLVIYHPKLERDQNKKWSIPMNNQLNSAIPKNKLKEDPAGYVSWIFSKLKMG